MTLLLRVLCGVEGLEVLDAGEPFIPLFYDRRQIESLDLAAMLRRAHLKG